MRSAISGDRGPRSVAKNERVAVGGVRVAMALMLFSKLRCRAGPGKRMTYDGLSYYLWTYGGWVIRISVYRLEVVWKPNPLD